MAKKDYSALENEFLGILLSAMKKGMTVEQFFAIADTTMNHMRGRIPNDTIAAIMADSASAGDVRELLATLAPPAAAKPESR